ncbi:MAG: hypothetical protein WB807_14810 [Candidatus Dormiibacterota bacterium]
MNSISKGDPHLTPERAALTPNPGGGLWELIRCFAHVSTLRMHDKSTALQVV